MLNLSKPHRENNTTGFRAQLLATEPSFSVSYVRHADRASQHRMLRASMLLCNSGSGHGLRCCLGNNVPVAADAAVLGSTLF